MSFRRLFFIVVFVSLLAVVAGSGYGQSQTAPATQPPSTATPSAPSSTAQDQTAPIPNANAGKVWTNEDIGTLRQGNGISVVGKNLPQKMSATSKTTQRTIPQEKNPAWYRTQLAQLQAEIDKLDGKITKLKAFLSGENVSDPPSMYRRMVPTPQDQLKQAESNRQADAAKMEDLLDRARHNGIEPGALR